MLRQVEFHIFLFFLLFLLIDWPFLAVSAASGLISVFSYLFLLWALFIFLLFLVQRSVAGDAPDGEGEDEGGA